MEKKCSSRYLNCVSQRQTKRLLHQRWGVWRLRVLWLSVALRLPAVPSPLFQAEFRLPRPPSAVSLLPSPAESAVVCGAAAWTSTVVGHQPVVSRERKGYLQKELLCYSKLQIAQVCISPLFVVCVLAEVERNCKYFI